MASKNLIQVYVREIHSRILKESKLFGSCVGQSCVGSGSLRQKGVYERCTEVHRNIEKDEEPG